MRRRHIPNNAYDWPWRAPDQPSNAHLPVPKHALSSSVLADITAALQPFLGTASQWPFPAHANMASQIRNVTEEAAALT